MPSPRPAVSHKVQTTVTQAPVVYRQERQLIAGRYRLVSFHRGDNSTEVWRALDESTTQIVSLEFLRDPDPASKEPFLAGARRLASVAQPTVMKVASIHDDADGTFIVFEHLVQIPVPLEWQKRAVEAPAPLLKMAEPPAAETPAETPAVVPEAVATGDHGLSLLLYAIRSRELSLIDQLLLQEAAVEFLDVVVADFKAVRLDPDLLPDARAFVVSLLMSGPRRAGAAIGRLATMRPRVRVATPRLSQPKQPKQPKPPKQPKQPKFSAPKIKETPLAAAKPIKMPKLKAPRAERTSGRGIRWGRVLSRGLVLGVLAAVLVSLPPSITGNLGNVASDVASNVATFAGNLAGQVSSAISEKIASTQTTPGLQRATFELPPLSSYGAAFESQAPYPTTHPNGTVEWTVALRNTGSVGWYRGIDGAQASLVLADGTTAGVQTTPFVGPGQVGWFVVHFPAPSTTGTSRVHLLPRIDGRGSLPDLGIYATVTVSPNP